VRPRARSAQVCLNDHCFYASNASNATPDALQFLDRAAELGAAGIQFSVLTSFRELSDSYVDEVRARAESLGLSIEVGMGACNPYSDCRAARDTGRDPRVSLGEILPVARRIGSPIVRTFLGFSRERFLPRARLAEQIEATVAVLRDVSGAAEALGVRIVLENHVDLTSRELVEMVERVDSPATRSRCSRTPWNRAAPCSRGSAPRT
jgi:sugar phosphate isomerase/epimerase